jgi:transposase
MVIADRGYDAEWIRALADEQGAWAKFRRKAVARTQSALARTYWIKQRCRFATRYDKLASNYLTFVELASIRLRLRAYEFTP